LLAGKTIEVEGEGKKEEAEDAGKSNLDSAAVNSAVDGFRDTQLKNLQSEHKETAKGMPRAFCVFVVQEKFDSDGNPTSTDYKNYRVLVGPQDKIDTLNKWMGEHIKGDFEVVERTQAI